MASRERGFDAMQLTAPLSPASRSSKRPSWRAVAIAAACGLLVCATGAASWYQERQGQAEAELHETWLPLVEATGDLKSDLDAWQEDPVPLMAERVDARLTRIRRLSEASSGLGGDTPTASILADVQGRWQALQAGRSSDWVGLHDRLRELSVTGLAQSERLAALASGRGA